jgi:hypothetical protein
MNELLHEIERNGFLYRFYDDSQGFDGSFDLGDEAANKEYTERFYREEFFAYYVTKNEKCKCCDQWKMIDDIGQIHAPNLGEAFDVALDYME